MTCKLLICVILRKGEMVMLGFNCGGEHPTDIDAGGLVLFCEGERKGVEGKFSPILSNSILARRILQKGTLCFDEPE